MIYQSNEDDTESNTDEEFPINDETQNDSTKKEGNPETPEETVTKEENENINTRLYVEYGVLVHILNNAAYHVTGRSMLKINTKNKISRIIPNPVIYDLT
mgnify:CR=1 FL=1